MTPLNTAWLAAAASVAWLAVLFLRWTARSQVPCVNSDAAASLSLAMFWLALPYVRILTSPRGASPAERLEVARGLALSAAWGVVNIVCALGLMAVVADSGPRDPMTRGDLLVLGLHAATQGVLIAAAAAALRDGSVVGGGRLAGGAALMATVYGLCALLLLTELSMSRHRQPGGWISTTIGALRTLSSAQIVYAEIHPDRKFALTLDELLAEGFIPLSFFTSDGRRLGTPYRFTLTGTPDDSGRVVAYQVSAFPELRGSCPSFYTDQEQIIRYTDEARQATATDPVLD
jgi:hypothetical protein